MFDYFACKVWLYYGIITNKERDVVGGFEMGRTIICTKCNSTFNESVLANRADPNVCPVCGASLVDESDVQSGDEHPDWITWYYYKDPKYGDYSLWDKLPLKPEELELIKEFKAPPRDSTGSSERAKEILRTYIPDAFMYKQEAEGKVRCPRCRSTEIQLVPRKFSLLTGFATNKFDRMCVRCQKRF